jgi:hypothetical protein
MEPAGGMVEGQELALSHKEAQSTNTFLTFLCLLCFFVATRLIGHVSRLK